MCWQGRVFGNKVVVAEQKASAGAGGKRRRALAAAAAFGENEVMQKYHAVSGLQRRAAKQSKLATRFPLEIKGTVLLDHLLGGKSLELYQNSFFCNYYRFA
jgi:hypothetical protein